MAEFEKPLPEWKAKGSKPPENKREEGWKARDKPPADWHNWWMNTSYEALKELQEKAVHEDGIPDEIETKEGAQSKASAAEENAKEYTAEHAKEKATTSNEGHVKLNDSVSSKSEDEAATAHAVKKAYDRANAAEQNAKNYTDEQLENYDETVYWKDVEGKPSGFPPESHGHEVGDVAGLKEELESKETPDGAQEKANSALSDAKEHTNDHAEKQDNPHKVTKSQLGLGEVTNDKQATESDFTNHIDDGSAHDIGNKSDLKTSEKSTIVGAMNELFTNVSDGKSLIGTAITDKDSSVNVPENATFKQFSQFIKDIDTGGSEIRRLESEIRNLKNSRKKWASGEGREEGSAMQNINVEGLDFKPTTIIVANSKSGGAFFSNEFSFEVKGRFGRESHEGINEVKLDGFTAGLYFYSSNGEKYRTFEWLAIG